MKCHILFHVLFFTPAFLSAQNNFLTPSTHHATLIRYYLILRAFLFPKSIYILHCRVLAFPLLYDTIFVSGYNGLSFLVCTSLVMSNLSLINF